MEISTSQTQLTGYDFLHFVSSWNYYSVQQIVAAYGFANEVIYKEDIKMLCVSDLIEWIEKFKFDELSYFAELLEKELVENRKKESLNLILSHFVQHFVHNSPGLIVAPILVEYFTFNDQEIIEGLDIYFGNNYGWIALKDGEESLKNLLKGLAKSLFVPKLLHIDTWNKVLENLIFQQIGIWIKKEQCQDLVILTKMFTAYKGSEDFLLEVLNHPFVDCSLKAQFGFYQTKPGFKKLVVPVGLRINAEMWTKFLASNTHMSKAVTSNFDEMQEDYIQLVVIQNLNVDNENADHANYLRKLGDFKGSSIMTKQFKYGVFFEIKH